MGTGSEDSTRRIQVRFDPTRAAPHGQEATEPSQQRGANAPTSNNEWAEAKPPDPRRCRGGDAEGKRFVVATVRSTYKNAWPRRCNALKPHRANAHPERTENHAQGEPEGSIGETRLGPGLAAKPCDALARCRRDQGISAVRAVRPYLSITHIVKPYTLPPPAMQGCRTPHSPLP